METYPESDIKSGYTKYHTVSFFLKTNYTHSFGEFRFSVVIDGKRKTTRREEKRGFDKAMRDRRKHLNPHSRPPEAHWPSDPRRAQRTLHRRAVTHARYHVGRNAAASKNLQQFRQEILSNAQQIADVGANNILK